MRAFGLVALLLGVFALVIPTMRAEFTLFSAFSTDTLRIIGGCLIVLGVAALWFTREN